MTFQDPLPILPVTRPVHGAVRVPGSKSYTNRALPIAALAAGPSRLTGVLDSEDTRVMIAALAQLGIVADHDPANRTVRVTGCDGEIPAAAARLHLGNSGTSMRFLTSVAALGRGVFVLDGVARMRERPMGDLLSALRQLQVSARSASNNDCPPIEIAANGIPGGLVSVKADVSSQFLSGLLIAAPLASGPLAIRVDGELVSEPYVDMTLAVMRDFGASFDRDGLREFRFLGRSKGQPVYVGREYAIEPDASSASYFFAAAAITAGSVTVEGLGSRSLQGDLQFVRLLERMGCRVEMGADSTTVHGGPLRGIDVAMTHLSDTVPTLAAVSCFADGPTRVRAVGHIRHKETDRISALSAELRKTGCRVDESPDGLTIFPNLSNPATFDTYNDHRMAMSLALLGLKHPGISIRDPGCTAKTYPTYFSDLAQISET